MLAQALGGALVMAWIAAVHMIRARLTKRPITVAGSVGVALFGPVALIIVVGIGMYALASLLGRPLFG